MKKRVFRVFLILGMFLTSCTAAPQQTPPTPTSTAPSQTILPSPSPTSSPSIPAEKTLPGPTQPRAVNLPELDYLLFNRLLELDSEGKVSDIAQTPYTGLILEAFRIEDTLLVMQDNGILRVRLNEDDSDLIYPFDKPALYGDLTISREGQQVFFLVVVDDPKADFSRSSMVGVYDLWTDAITPVITIPHNTEILGLSADGQGLYLLFHGMDTALVKIFYVDLQKREITHDLSILGDMLASLAPDGIHLVSFNPTYDPTSNALGVFNLTAAAGTPPQVYFFPGGAFHINGNFVWSPDSRFVYFLPVSGYYWEDPTAFLPFGLWRLDIVTGELRQLSPVSSAEFFLERITPDGEWLLLMGAGSVIWVNAYSGAQKELTLPAAAILVDGQ